MVGKFSIPATDDRRSSRETRGWFFGELFKAHGVRENRSIEQDNVFANNGLVSIVFMFGTVGPREICHVLYA